MHMQMKLVNQFVKRVPQVDPLLLKEVLIVIHVHQEIFFPPLVVNHAHRVNTTNKLQHKLILIFARIVQKENSLVVIRPQRHYEPTPVA